MLAIAVMVLVYAALLGSGAISFVRASWIIGGDIAQMGVVAFAIVGVLYGASSVGLFRRRTWALWLAVVLMALGVVEQIPAISAMDWRWWPVLREAGLIVARVACIQYLTRSDVRDSMKSRA